MIAARPIMLATAVLLPTPVSAAPPSWNTYANARYAYEICYPADILRPLPEADNGDGRRFVGENGAVLAVWGLYNAQDQRLDMAHGAQRGLYYRARFTVTYDRMGTDWYVLSGTKGRQIFYRKTILAGDRWVTMEMRYPAADKARWTPVTERLSHCLRPLREQQP